MASLALTHVPSSSQPTSPPTKSFPSRKHIKLKHDGTLPFHGFPQRDDVVKWTSSISRHCRNGQLSEALMAFFLMRSANIEPNHVTFVTLLSACADFPSDAFGLGLAVHGYICKLGFEDRNVALGTAVIDMYAKCGDMDSAEKVFHQMTCANLGGLGHGLWVHRYVLVKDFSKNVRVNNSLIDMYARCGSISLAAQVFEEMHNRSIVSWNSIIVGFAINGYAAEALEHFTLMGKAGLQPDGVTFTGALTACSHAGKVSEGLQCFDKMRKVYGISPRVEHYGCIIDLLSRTGQLDKAFKLIKRMPMKPNEVILGSLLAACRVHGNVVLAERLMGYLLELKPDSDSNFVLLSNIYATHGRWDGVGQVRKAMKKLGIRKRPGVSSVEISGTVHEFVAGDNSHSYSDDILNMLGQLTAELKLYGYVPEVTTGGSEND
ncbi:hypothetical protein H6P81_010361 [Aristolochia fimbriata]|uniref:Pentatricopeptide repeat-containing protein n=1 Tax=Aristolochia fimbriata TaxID=158543 RepID=A0AAV7EPP4_ARIFI|nr:hypothetical protein H6P81_010361 [Aristolochia fimbriata]